MSKWLIPSIALLSLIFLACAGPTTTTKDPSIDSLPPRPSTPPEALGGGNILIDYDKNPVAAAERYERKWLRVFGEIFSISPEAISLDAAGTNSLVRCRLEDGQLAQVKKLQKGDGITVEGFCTGRLAGALVLEQCRIILVPPNRR